MLYPFCSVLELARLSKKWNKDCFVSIGGPHATLDPVNSLKRNECIDFAFRYDSENTLPASLDIIAKHNYRLANLVSDDDLAKVPSISYRNSLNEVKLTAAEMVTKDFSKYPKCDRTIFNMDWYKQNDPETVLMTARGCPGVCSFCAT
ncbi:MAG: hypothetical protein HQK51_16780, partial [Oligoflexia bacterium]|nr:hypothetical protein [Oligoflexia bacterium]